MLNKLRIINIFFFFFFSFGKIHSSPEKDRSFILKCEGIISPQISIKEQFFKEYEKDWEKCFDKNERPEMLIKVLLNIKSVNRPFLIKRLLNSFKYQSFNNYSIVFITNDTSKKKHEKIHGLSIIKKYQESDRRIILTTDVRQSTDLQNFNYKVMINFKENDMLFSKDTLSTLSTGIQEIRLNQERIKTLEGEAFVFRHIRKEICKKFLTYINHGGKIKDLYISKVAKNLFKLYHDANYCLQKYKKMSLIPLLKKKEIQIPFDKSKFTPYKSVFFFAYNRNYTEEFLGNIEEKFISKNSQLITFDAGNFIFRLKQAIFETSGFIPNYKKNSFSNIQTWRNYEEEVNKIKGKRKSPLFIKKLLKRAHYEKLFYEFTKFSGHPSLKGVCDKGNCALNYKEMKKIFPDEYNYQIKTYVYPEESMKILKEFKDFTFNMNNLWLIKKRGSSLGKGIYFLTDKEQIKGEIVLSKYISNPQLINGKKMNLRVYVLISSFNPLIIYMHKEGYIFLATQDYNLTEESIKSKPFAHISNICFGEKDKGNFIYNSEENINTKKKKFSNVLMMDTYKNIVEKEGGNFNLIMKKIKDICIKVILSIQGSFEKDKNNFTLNNENNYALLGFDILVDDNFEPHFIEVNTNPGMDINDEALKKFKDKVYADALNLARIFPFDKRTDQPLEKLKIADNIKTDKNKKLVKTKRNNVKYSVYEIEEMPKGDFELIFPLKENIRKYARLLTDKSKRNLLLFQYLNKNFNYDEPKKTGKDSKNKSKKHKISKKKNKNNKSK